MFGGPYKSQDASSESRDWWWYGRVNRDGRKRSVMLSSGNPSRAVGNRPSCVITFILLHLVIICSVSLVEEVAHPPHVARGHTLAI